MVDENVFPTYSSTGLVGARDGEYPVKTEVSDSSTELLLSLLPAKTEANNGPNEGE